MDGPIVLFPTYMADQILDNLPSKEGSLEISEKVLQIPLPQVDVKLQATNVWTIRLFIIYWMRQKFLDFLFLWLSTLLSIEVQGCIGHVFNREASRF